jgi:hypothetical protein
MSGPWFYVIPITVNGGADDVAGTRTDVHVFPGRDIQMDAPITSQSWVWASISERASDGRPFLGDTLMSVGNVLSEDDGGVRVRILNHWPNSLNGLLKMPIWI